MSSHSDTATALTRRRTQIGVMREVSLKAGGSMDRHLSMVAGDAPGSDLDVSKIPTLRAAFRGPVRTARTASGKVAQNAQPQRKVAGTAQSPGTLADTNTRLVLKGTVARNTPVFFAVQLQWSVQPIDVQSIPRHPIFQAYTLYAAEGRRAGCMWFFLRLGFFNDAVSAKQVARYLRGDFASAAVVPVSSQERQQATQIGR